MILLNQPQTTFKSLKNKKGSEDAGGVGGGGIFLEGEWPNITSRSLTASFIQKTASKHQVNGLTKNETRYFCYYDITCR